MITEQNFWLFPFLNHELVRDILDFDERKPLAVLKFEQMNLSYVGELAERWEERGIAKDERDLVSLIAALALSYKGYHGYHYNQKELFFTSMAEHLLNKRWDLTAAVALCDYAKRHLTSKFISSDTALFKRIMEETAGEIEQVNRAYLISVTALISHCTAVEKWKRFAIGMIENLEIKTSNIFNEWFLFDMLSDVHYHLGAPKAAEVKKKGAATLLAAISNLKNKELAADSASNSAAVIGVAQKDVFALNYLLSVHGESDTNRRKITKPGEQRIAENFVQAFLTDAGDPQQEFFDYVQHDNLSVKHLCYNVDRVANHKSFAFIVKSWSKHSFAEYSNLSYLSALKDERAPLIDMDLKKKIVTKLLTLSNLNLGKKDFLFLENLRCEMRGEEIDPSRARYGMNKDYFFNCFKYGVLDIANIDLLEKKSCLAMAAEYAKRNFKIGEYIGYMERVPEAHYADIVERLDYCLAQAQEDEMKTRVFTLYFKGLFYQKPEGYAQKFAELLCSPEFVKIAGYSAEEIASWEKQLAKSELVPEPVRENLRKKYLTEEEKEKENAEKLVESIKKAYYFSYEIMTNLEQIIKHEPAKNACFDKLMEHAVKDAIDCGRFLTLFYKLKPIQLFNDEQMEKLEERALKLAASY